MVQMDSLDLLKKVKFLGGQKADLLFVGLEEDSPTQD